MTPLERLLAEAIPDGTFGGARTTQAAEPRTVRREIAPDPMAAHHRAVLEAALDEREGRGTGRPDRRLRAVPDPANHPHGKAA